MKARVPFMIVVAVAGLAPHAVLTRAEAPSKPPRLELKVTQNTTRLMPYQVFELTFQHDGKYHSPTWDVTIDVTFTSPGGEKATVGGFFYGSSSPQKPVIREVPVDGGRVRQVADWPCDPADLWKARYAPSELGRWTYTYVFRNVRGERATGRGAFEVVKRRVTQKGWVRIHPTNPFRLVREDGSLFFPIGFQDGVGGPDHLGFGMDSVNMEGPFKLRELLPAPTKSNPPKLPPGPMFVRGPSMNPQNGDVCFRRHAYGGFNLWRFSPNNCTPKLFAHPRNPQTLSPDHVRWEQALVIDEMLQMLQKYKIRVFYGIFGYSDFYAWRPSDAEGMAKVKRMIKYSVDRWGAYVDFWEMQNERMVSDEWYEIAIPYLKSIDPYGKPVSTSWDSLTRAKYIKQHYETVKKQGWRAVKDRIEGLDIHAPHRYEGDPELSCDLIVANLARKHKQLGLPVIFGEMGTQILAVRASEGGTGTWDPGSARRMRVELWTTLFQEIHFIYWMTSYAKDGYKHNQWIGPEERQYCRALRDFARRLDADVRMVDVPVQDPQAKEVRAYGLRSEKCAAVYLHHHACAECRRLGGGWHPWNHDRGEVRDLKVTVDVPRAASGYWYRPTDAHILTRFTAPAGRGEFTAPPFAIDLALLITPSGAPDIDDDGLANDKDPDDDNDGVPDAKDAFPLDREEWADADGDRIGDNLDADIDADGKGDDRNKNGIPDHLETDLDGDGVPRTGADRWEHWPLFGPKLGDGPPRPGVVFWDSFPNDPKEWRDTDGDGVGDNADQDDDGDGYSDREERRAGTDPLDRVSFPAE